MAYCPSCGCQMSGVARFCPMCGVTIRQDAVNVRLDNNAEIPQVELPKPNDQLIRDYVGLNSCGAGVIRALRVLAALLAIVIGVCGVTYGVMLLLDGNKLHGIMSLVLGPGVGLLLYVIMLIGIVLYENVSFIGRHTETQNRIAAAQLELIRNINQTQNESLHLAKQTIEMLKIMDGDRFDAAKQAEQQTELMERLLQSQQSNEKRLDELKNFSDQLARTAVDHVRSAQSWRSNTRQFAHAIALAVSQLPDRLRSALNGEQAAEDESLAQLDVLEPEKLPEEQPENTSEPDGGQAAGEEQE